MTLIVQHHQTYCCIVTLLINDHVSMYFGFGTLKRFIYLTHVQVFCTPDSRLKDTALCQKHPLSISLPQLTGSEQKQNYNLSGFKRKHIIQLQQLQEPHYLLLWFYISN